MIGPAVFLMGAAVVTVPLFRRIGLGSVLGYFAAGLLVGGTVLKEFVVTGVGVAGVFVYLPMSGAQYFGETIGVPIVLLATGALLMGLMVLLLRRGAGPRPSPPTAGPS